MRVFNLTDVSTPTLEQRNLVNQHFAVGRRMVVPGEYVEVEDTPMIRASLLFLLQVGAASIDRPSPTYIQTRQRLSAQTGKLGSVVPVRHLDLQETKLAGIPVAPPAIVEGAVELTKYDPAAATADAAPVILPQHKGGGSKKKGRR